MLKFLRITTVSLWFALSTTCISLLLLFRPKNPANNVFITHTICRVACKILGIRVDQRGQGFYDPACVYVANHQATLDIFTIGSIFPTKTFVIAKDTLRFMPFFGWVFILGGNLFISRGNRTSALASLEVAENVITRDQKSILLFPEGTRSRGKGLAQFKKGAFHVALHTKAPIVPIVVGEYEYDFNQWKTQTVPIYIGSPIASDKFTEENVETFVQTTHEFFQNKIEEMRS